MFQEFTGTGIKINFVRHSSGEVLARIMAEKDNPRVEWCSADLPIPSRRPLTKVSLSPTFSAGVRAIPEKHRHPKGYYTGIALNPIVFLFEPRLPRR